MRKALVISTATAALAFGASFAGAQDNKSEGAAPAPPALQNAPAEKMAPPLQKNDTAPKGLETTGESPAVKPEVKPNVPVPDKSEIPQNQPGERGRLQSDTGR